MKDIYDTITNQIVAAIEKNPGSFQMPWHRGGAFGVPKNAHTGAMYQGVNILNLWVCGMGYAYPVWASYKQWRELGCQVRKGEKASPIVYYSTYEKGEGEEAHQVPFIRYFSVFNADQVDGFTPPTKKELPPLERLEKVDAFVQATGAKIIEGGTVACYNRLADTIRMPDGDRFIDTSTSKRTECFYSVLCHELTHWSGAPARLDREKGTRFGDAKYAFEELVAELGAAFLCAQLAITPEVRDDHAAYITNWLNALKNEKKFVFAAAAQAQAATDYLLALSEKIAEAA